MGKWSKSHISHSVTSVGDFRTNLRPSLGTGVGSLPEEVESQEHVLGMKMLLDWGGESYIALSYAKNEHSEERAQGITESNYRASPHSDAVKTPGIVGDETEKVREQGHLVLKKE